jgi:hypothetical protein
MYSVYGARAIAWPNSSTRPSYGIRSVDELSWFARVRGGGKKVQGENRGFWRPCISFMEAFQESFWWELFKRSWLLLLQLTNCWQYINIELLESGTYKSINTNKQTVQIRHPYNLQILLSEMSSFNDEDYMLTYYLEWLVTNSTSPVNQFFKFDSQWSYDADFWPLIH